ncbi:MAG: hypothetical protein JWQ49_3086 [Edaphobacter sp.]|nr:hypothetical protein [Edaphobacter sp.]
MQVAPGTYDYGNSSAQFTKSGTAGNYITVTCATRGACKIQNSLTGNTTVVYLKSSYITFDGFEVTNTSSAGNNLGLYVTSSFVNITRNTVHHIETDCGDMGGGGIVVAGGGSVDYQLSNITIDSNLVYDISMPNGVPRCNSSVVQTDGILDENDANYNVITNNIVYWVSGGWGMAIGNGCCTGGTVIGNQISNNLVFSTARGGIATGASAGMFMTNNIIVDAGLNFNQCAYMLAPTPPITYANSDLFNNGGGNYCANWSTTNSSIHAGDIAVDPASGTTFVNWQGNGSGDYHEKAGSSTIGVGSTAGTPPNHDFDGNPRPATGIDIGPYQNHQ